MRHVHSDVLFFAGNYERTRKLKPVPSYSERKQNMNSGNYRQCAECQCQPSDGMDLELCGDCQGVIVDFSPYGPLQHFCRDCVKARVICTCDRQKTHNNRRFISNIIWREPPEYCWSQCCTCCTSTCSCWCCYFFCECLSAPCVDFEPCCYCTRKCGDSPCFCSLCPCSCQKPILTKR